MKKILLTSILSLIVAVPAFATDPVTHTYDAPDEFTQLTGETVTKAKAIDDTDTNLATANYVKGAHKNALEYATKIGKKSYR